MIDNRHIIAKNIAHMLNDGDAVNLGVGMPALVGHYIPEGVTVFLHGENGCLGQDKEFPRPFNVEDREDVIRWLRANGDSAGNWRTGHRDLSNANNNLITLLPGGCCFDSAMAFAIVRGGHLDATVLGGLQVDQEGNLANWGIPGKRMNGMGGAMDLVNGAKRVIVAMEHLTKTGEPKFVKTCTLPLTGIHCVTTLVTNLCIAEFHDGQPMVTAMAPGLSKDRLIELTEAKLTFAPDIDVMLLPNE